jgi:hypothetical protein
VIRFNRFIATVPRLKAGEPLNTPLGVFLQRCLQRLVGSVAR